MNHSVCAELVQGFAVAVASEDRQHLAAGVDDLGGKVVLVHSVVAVSASGAFDGHFAGENVGVAVPSIHSPWARDDDIIFARCDGDADCFIHPVFRRLTDSIILAVVERTDELHIIDTVYYLE